LQIIIEKGKSITGVIMYILLVGYPPYFEKTRADIFKRIEKAEFSLAGKE